MRSRLEARATEWIFGAKEHQNCYSGKVEQKKLIKIYMENTQLLDQIAGGLAIAIVVGGMLMMFTNIFTTKKK